MIDAGLPASDVRYGQRDMKTEYAYQFAMVRKNNELRRWCKSIVRIYIDMSPS